MEEEEDAELQVEFEDNAQQKLASVKAKQLASAKAICYEWMNLQYKRTVRLVGFTACLSLK